MKDFKGKTAIEKPIPAEEQERFQKWRHTLEEKAAELDDHLTEKYLNGQPMTATVLPNDTIKSVAARLVTVLNLPTYTNATKIRASARGDRIELQFFDLAKPGSQVPVAASSSIGSASALTTSKYCSPHCTAVPGNSADVIVFSTRGVQPFDSREKRVICSPSTRNLV